MAWAVRVRGGDLSRLLSIIKLKSPPKNPRFPQNRLNCKTVWDIKLGQSVFGAYITNSEMHSKNIARN